MTMKDYISQKCFEHLSSLKKRGGIIDWVMMPISSTLSLFMIETEKDRVDHEYIYFKDVEEETDFDVLKDKGLLHQVYVDYLTNNRNDSINSLL